jgi:hypothetical protein
MTGAAGAHAHAAIPLLIQSQQQALQNVKLV